MNKLLSVIALGACLSFGAAHAQDKMTAPAEPMKAETAQQSKMGACNTEAGDKKGAERKAYMKSCLSAKPMAAAVATEASPQKTQQNKMKTCNADAKTKALKGAERKGFMKTCLSN